ncbi:hypothetical protein FHS76_000858 [Ochrobactrum daejeonense]|uniref:Uncharacterized protein n=1 Tax=Brucella daejeonensis TaxID=659015 RepID=A0A7W9EK73_9HYPH|nr:hypothetical protein [Brucella daejeonensis]MBB5701009.1 hypothetical protein [Brucella daejeonensis]
MNIISAMIWGAALGALFGTALGHVPTAAAMGAVIGIIYVLFWAEA